MNEKIGVPRALLYFKFFPLWKKFLQELDYSVILSPETNQKILDKGVELGFSELCLPVKLYHGHVAILLDENPDLDYIFIPRYISLEPSGFYCPKFLSLPDAMKAQFDNLPPVLEWEINAKKGLKIVWAIQFGRRLGVSPAKAVDAYTKAVKFYKDFQETVRSGVPFPMALKCIEENCPLPNPDKIEKHPFTIFVLGHPYNTYESFTNMNMIDKIQEMGANVLTLESLPKDAFKGRVKVSGKFDNYWGNEQEILQASNYFYERGKTQIDGVIFLISFACGPDSLIAEIVMRDMKERGVPYMSLILDEHSGSAGLMTRIETFIDMIKRRKFLEVSIK
ncbi:MAG: acyl-CoA dehydratase activase-related protein [Promethearchaeota archaeon]